MFIIRKKFEISNHEVMDFVRLLGRFGLKFKVSDEHEIPNQDGKTKDRYRVFTLFGTRRQISEFMEARDIIYEYHLH
jgi:hypothetical protein